MLRTCGRAVAVQSVAIASRNNAAGTIRRHGCRLVTVARTSRFVYATA
jgi:hypothetical protein